LDPHDEVLINVGRQVFAKGQGFLLEAFSTLALKHPRATLLIAGPRGPATEQLNRLRAVMPNGHRVRILGHRNDIPELLAAADAFVFPSLYEGMPGAVIEAMAVGLPIIASNICAVAEVADQNRNALLVPPGNVSELASAISALLTNHALRNSLAAHGRRRFLERFTLQHSTHRMAELFRRVIQMAAP
jgi:glycosyltransferase involved in cell wall biosynthesis